jgi:quercetin dioxygenase-like cupin family protein
MNILKKNSSPRYKRDDITSYLLVSKLTCNSDNLAITLVEMEPGGVQHIHNHEPEQMYYILEGSGVMTVDDERNRSKRATASIFPRSPSTGWRTPEEPCCATSVPPRLPF